MKRASALLALMMVIALCVAGCGGDQPTEAPDDTAAPATEPAPSGGGASDAFQALSTDGPGESAALAAMPAALAEGRAMQETAGQTWPDLNGIEPRLTAYILAADMDGQTTLFEVRADGIAHSLYAYQRAFDSGSLLWSDSENSSSPRATPQSDAEKAAVASVEAVMRDSFPEGAFAVSLYGYRFVFLGDNTPILTLEMDTVGSVMSVGN